MTKITATYSKTKKYCHTKNLNLFLILVEHTRKIETRDFSVKSSPSSKLKVKMLYTCVYIYI